MKHLKSRLLVFVLLLSSIGISAQQRGKEPSAQPDSTRAEVLLTNSADSSQYILGAYLGQYLNANGLTITNANLFIKGMNDVLSNNPLLVDADSIPGKMNEYLTKMNRERNQLLEKQLFENVKGQPGVGMLPSGVCYIITKPGTGIRPTARDTIVIDAIGIFPDGTVFEDTYEKEQPITTVTGNLIPGLNETIQLMPEGSSWRIFIPSDLAYGTAGLSNVIPPYMALVFDITLNEVKRLEEQQ